MKLFYPTLKRLLQKVDLKLDWVEACDCDRGEKSDEDLPRGNAGCAARLKDALRIYRVKN